MMDTISAKYRSCIVENENRDFSPKSKQIFQDSHCTIHAISRHYEVWAKLHNKVVIPTDEHFGLWAWSAYTKERAELIANELRTGKRTVEISWKEEENE
jgi:hypothetical protein